MWKLDLRDNLLRNIRPFYLSILFMLFFFWQVINFTRRNHRHCYPYLFLSFQDCEYVQYYKSIKTINILMRNFNVKDNSGQFSNQTYFKLKKINSLSHLKTLQNSRVSATSSKNSQKRFHKIIKLQNSFYNDKNYRYLDVSQTLSQKLTQYQRRQISFYERKKYQSTHIQKVVQKRQRSLSHSNLLTKTHSNLENFKNKLNINEEALKSKTICVHKQKFKNHTILKYNKLLNGSKQTIRNKKNLDIQIKNTLQTSASKKWKSPFKHSNSIQSNFLGKKLTSSLRLSNRKFNPEEQTNQRKDHNQLKVLNLDRMFRSKSGKFGSIVPLPVAKLQSVNSREFLMNKIKSKDKLHDVIQDYNGLLKIYKRHSNKVFLGVKGHHYIQTPSIQDIVGIKLRPKAKIEKTVQGIPDEVFVNNCQLYIKLIKKDKILSNRLICGIKMQGTSINLQVFTRFYILFVNKISTFQQKINFLSYFFIPSNFKYADIEQVTQVLQILCQKLPKIQKLNIKTDLLSNQQKSKIFLEALNRVLFTGIDIKNPKLHRQSLQQILRSNSEAVDLLVRLLQLE